MTGSRAASRPPRSPPGWAAAGGIPDLAALRLCQLYGYGLPPIPPKEWANPSAARWLAFRFFRDDMRRHLRTEWRQWCLLHRDDSRGANAEQIRMLTTTLADFTVMEARLRRTLAAARAADAEATRWRELVANQA